MKDSENKKVFIQGMRDGLPIGLGYLAVSFSLGIFAKNVGLNAFQAFLTSLLCNASAGEYIGFSLIASSATYIEMAIMTFIANARYLLMSCALSQKVSSDMKFGHRLLIGFDITDEFFAIAISRDGKLNPFYLYGAMIVASPMWATGTALGVIAGSVLPVSVVSALSVALYGMFLAVIIPPAKKDRIIAVLIAVCFALSYVVNYVHIFDNISSGVKTIILTLVISTAAALIFPKKATQEAE
ncbi:MAG: AzlC family ABC transporter permease [Acutalibacteraceae bacterium]|nr:AzlC family ABC transporter permease [Acutalibacteraceae bacterium]